MLKHCSIFVDQELEIVPKYKFFQIKKSKIKNSDRLLLQFIDIDGKIFYDDVKAQEEYMNITTSTISHEMRNPLNSIMAQCLILAGFCLQLLAIFTRVAHRLTREELAEMTEIVENMQEGVGIMKTSAQLLLFNVEDVLGMA